MFTSVTTVEQVHNNCLFLFVFNFTQNCSTFGKLFTCSHISTGFSSAARKVYRFSFYFIPNVLKCQTHAGFYNFRHTMNFTHFATLNKFTLLISLDDILFLCFICFNTLIQISLNLSIFAQFLFERTYSFTRR